MNTNNRILLVFLLLFPSIFLYLQTNKIAIDLISNGDKLNAEIYISQIDQPYITNSKK